MGVLIGPSTGSIGTAGNAMMHADDQGGGAANNRGRKSADPAKELGEIRPEAGVSQETLRQRKAGTENAKEGATRATWPDQWRAGREGCANTHEVQAARLWFEKTEFSKLKKFADRAFE